MAKLTGHEAIKFAKLTGQALNKYTDPTEEAREGLTVAEAEQVAMEDPGLIWIDAPRFGFEARTKDGRWSREAAGEQDASNYLDTREAAEAELPRLAEALGCSIDDVRVVEV